MAASSLFESFIADFAAAHGFAVRLAGGRELGVPAAQATFVLVLRSTALPARIARNWSPLRLGEAWIDGELDLEGDIFAAMEALHGIEGAMPSTWTRALGLVRRVTRRWRDAGRDISAHYDLPSAFYELFLDERMVYTCAYYGEPDSSLDEAQRHKLDLVCRKLRLAPGEEFLDLGCGWGALACWAAANYGVRAYGVTLSAEQARWAAAAVARAGLSGRVVVEHLDYRQIASTRRYDKVAAVGVIEHVGRHAYADYFGRVRGLLNEGGLFLNHGITMREGAAWSSEMEFLHRHVFPGLDLVDAASTLTAIERSGMEVLDVENLRPHYARTTREWAQRLWRRRDEASAIVGERVWRIWVGYLAAASVAFRQGWIGLHQVVAARDAVPNDGRAPRLREDVYTACAQEPRPHQYQARPSAASSSSQ